MKGKDAFEEIGTQRFALRGTTPEGARSPYKPASDPEFVAHVAWGAEVYATSGRAWA